VRVLAFRHSPSDGLGLIGDALDVYAISYDYADLYAPLSAAPLVSEADALILMGGSMSANDALPFIPREIEYIKGAVWTLYPWT
jgi:GMP synthase-like glutamine amidotransferase